MVRGPGIDNTPGIKKEEICSVLRKTTKILSYSPCNLFSPILTEDFLPHDIPKENYRWLASNVINMPFRFGELVGG